jgi:hypothetical protein
MIKKTIFLILMTLFIFYSCNTQEMDLAKQLYDSIQRFDTEEVASILSQGADPNYCRGESGWFDSNPLSVISWYNTRSYFGIIKGNL